MVWDLRSLGLWGLEMEDGEFNDGGRLLTMGLGQICPVLPLKCRNPCVTSRLPSIDLQPPPIES